MAKLGMYGLDDLLEDMEDVMNIPDDTIHDMLDAQADIVVPAQKEQIRTCGLVDTGQLADSISRTNKLTTTGIGKSISIYPQGVRNDGTRNAEVGFINEYGAPKRKIKASNWMHNANEKSADEAANAALSVYDNYLKSKNL